MSAQREPVHIGQVWEDCDRRMHGRRVTVEDIDETHAIVKSNGGQRTRIRLDRMRPTSTGFRLVSDPARVVCAFCQGRGYVSRDEVTT